jgi:hypothetical protein
MKNALAVLEAVLAVALVSGSIDFKPGNEV